MSIFGDLDQEAIDEIKPMKFGATLGPNCLTLVEATAAFANSGAYGMTVFWQEPDEGGRVREYITLPYDSQDPDKRAKTIRYLAAWCESLGIARSQWGDLEPDDDGEVEGVLGIECDGIVIEKQNDDYTDKITGENKKGGKSQEFIRKTPHKSGPLKKSAPRVANDEDFGI